MAPTFLTRKSDRRDEAESDVSAAEESSPDGLTVDMGQGKKRRRSFLDRIPSVSTDTLAIITQDSTSRPALNEKSSNGFLSTVNNLLRSPRSAVTDSDNSLKPPVGRPRARTAPSTPSHEAVSVEPIVAIELPAHVPPREEEITPQTTDVLSTVQRPEEKEESGLWASSWFRRPQEVVTTDLEKTPTMPDPVSHPGSARKENEISPRNQMHDQEPQTPKSSSQAQLQTPKPTPEPQVRELKSVGTVELPVHPALRSEKSTTPPSAQRPHARSTGPGPPPGRPFIPMPSWPVSGPPNALLGPIPPGAGPAPPPFAHFPRVPFFAPPNRSSSVPIPPPAYQSQSHYQSQPQQSHPSPLPTPPPTQPSRPNASIFNSTSELSALRTAHAALQDSHARDLAALHHTITTQRSELDAQGREITSLRTHIALLERAASLGPGRHLSPSGLLPPLNTSPETILREHEERRATRVSEGTSEGTRASMDSGVSRHSMAQASVSVSSASPSEHAEFALELENLKTALARRSTDLNSTVAAMATLQHQLDEARGELKGLKEERDLAVATVKVKEKKEGQMMTAMRGAAKRENALKVRVGEVAARLELANEERVDLREAWEEMKKRMKGLEREVGEGKKGEREAREGMERMMGEVAKWKREVEQRDRIAIRGEEKEVVELRRRMAEMVAKVEEVEKEMAKTIEEMSREAETREEKAKEELTSKVAETKKEVEKEIKGKITELEKALNATRMRLEVERDQTATAKKELIDEKKGGADLKIKVSELEKQLASPVDQMGMITIANALGKEYGGISPVGPTSVVGRLHLLRSEVRHLDADERQKLADELRRLEGGGKIYAETSIQTDKATEERRDKEREKAHKIIVRKLEAERDQLSGLLSTEIRRSARQSAKGEEFQGLGRLERWDSVSSRMSTLRGKPSSISLNSSDSNKHAACEEVLDKARQGYEEEIRGLVKEIVLYKLDIKGYKKDLRKANTALKMLKQVSTPTSAGDRTFPDSAKVEPLSLRSRASTTNIAQESIKESVRPDLGRTKSVDGLGITFGTSPRAEEEGDETRLGRKDSGFGKADVVHGKTELRGAGASSVAPDGASTSSTLSPDFCTGELERAGTQRSVAQSIISSYGKDRNSVPPDAVLDDEELRPLSTVAEVGSA
ncbi:hypothetical protein C1H76_5009 [Elsinoe australis]|uniref:Uncharacterized protein n=1 Tax=Elsinoe australis TaxID=40998 RepID=A0A4U7AWR5_9PEZI|nr:hypothetical protein C1H76_5009 [Elsinoe australis]